MALPQLLSRDALWTPEKALPELELVVDSQTLADLANIRTRVQNEIYRPIIDRIRTNLEIAFSNWFEQKAGYLDPVDWRPR